MTPAIVMFTADLRTYDHPALQAALRSSFPVVGIFVRDQSLAWTRPSPRYVAVSVALTALAKSLHAQGIPLIVRDGDPVEETVRLAQALNAAAIYLSADVTPRARKRAERLRTALAKPGDLTGRAAHLRCQLNVIDGVMDVVSPGVVSPVNSDHYRQFGAYYRAWQQAPRRPVVGAVTTAQDGTQLPARLLSARIDDATLLEGQQGRDDAVMPPHPSLTLPVDVDEGAARRRLAAWQRNMLAMYATHRDDLSIPGTSRLSAALHVGALSPNEVADVSAGHDAFVRQLAWRDFNRQIVAAQPQVLMHGLYPHRRAWIDDDDGFTAWTSGQTGFPVVDAAMRQLAQTGWMHNRARMVVASFLTKHLGVHWQRGADWFLDHLVDGDVVNNTLQWQWVAGVGSDARPGRMFNPVLQSENYDPRGQFIRRWVTELRGLDHQSVHDPWHRAPLMAERCRYPRPLVDHREARERFFALLR